MKAEQRRQKISKGIPMTDMVDAELNNNKSRKYLKNMMLMMKIINERNIKNAAKKEEIKYMMG